MWVLSSSVRVLQRFYELLSGLSRLLLGLERVEAT